MKRFSYKSIYYRDSDGVQKRIPGGLRIMIDNEKGVLVKVYTLSDQEGIFAEDNDYQKAIYLELPK